MTDNPIGASVPGEWPDAEPESVRIAEAAEERAARRAQLERLDEWTRKDVERLAEALRTVTDDEEHGAAWQLGYLSQSVRVLLWSLGLLDGDEL